MIKTMYDLEENINVGIVQTTINNVEAWKKGSKIPRISSSQDVHVWHEICKAMREFVDGDKKPQIILFPELSIPITRLDDFEKLVAELNVIAIAGIDYQVDTSKRIVKNEGIVFVPQGFWRKRPSRYCTRIIFGKSHPAPLEKFMLSESSPKWTFSGDNNVYLFNLHQFGNVGVSICYDFMDIERALMYRGKIHHLFVIAYNKDIGMFHSLAESLSRTVYCNVVVCNTGFYGGSVAVSPFYDSFRRKVFSHEGNRLFTTQVFTLPLKKLADSMNGNSEKIKVKQKDKLIFKAPPPGINIK